MLFLLEKLPEISNLTRFLKSFCILYIDQIIVYNTFYSTLTFYIIKDRCQMQALKVFRSPMWLLLHKLSLPHYHYIRKMRHGDRLPLTQTILWNCTYKLLKFCIFFLKHKYNFTEIDSFCLPKGLLLLLYIIIQVEGSLL